MFFLKRYYCDVLDEMRKIVKHLSPKTAKHQKEILLSLIEECQVYGNRMEAGLGDKKDFIKGQEELSKLRKEIKALKKEKEKLEECTHCGKKSKEDI